MTCEMQQMLYETCCTAHHDVILERDGEKKFGVSRIKIIHINNRINCRLLYIACMILEFQQLKDKYQINHQQVFTATCH